MRLWQERMLHLEEEYIISEPRAGDAF